MSYTLRFDARAAADLGGVPLSLIDAVERELGRLAADPVRLSVRSAFPFPPDRQLFHFAVPDHTGEPWHFAAHFRYGQDEQTLYVFRVTAAPP